MSTEVRIPAIGFSAQQATLTECLGKDGEQIEKGQLMYILELDKSVQEVEAPATGTLKLIAQEGETYAVGALIAEIQ